MAKLTTEEFIEAIKELSVLELNDLVKACEEEFGVSAAAGVVVAAAGAAGEAAGGAGKVTAGDERGKCILPEISDAGWLHCAEYSGDRKTQGIHGTAVALGK